MKKTLLLVNFAFAIIFTNSISAQTETEPNNTCPNANYFDQGPVTYTGTINDASDIDMWILPIPNNAGSVNVSFSYDDGLGGMALLPKRQFLSQNSCGGDPCGAAESNANSFGGNLTWSPNVPPAFFRWIIEVDNTLPSFFIATLSFPIQYTITFNNSSIPMDQGAGGAAPVAPGGVGGANLWLKANEGASPSNGTLTGWIDQAGTHPMTIDGDPLVDDSGANFNASVGFDATDDAVTTPYDLDLNTNSFSISTVVNVSSNVGYKSIITNKDAGATEYKGYIMYVNGTNIEFWMGNGVGWTTLNGGAVPLNENINITATYDAGSLKLYKNGILAGSTTLNYDKRQNTSLPFRVGMGSNSASVPSYGFIGEIPEVMYYPSELPSIDRVKTQSYLALKYGITLNQSVSSYKNSSNTVIWNKTTHWKDVFGIGKDDATGLVQTSSNSTNTGSGDGTGQTGKGNIVLSNPSSLGNNDFLMIGHDNGALTDQVTDMPASLQNNCKSRIAREWKVQRTGDVGTVSLTFDFNGLTFSGALGTNSTDFGILIDTDGDGDFSTGTQTTVQASAKNGDLISFTNLNLPNDAVFTFYMPVDFSNASTDVRTECAPFTWIDGNNYTSNNNSATFVLQNQSGCDSTVTLNLTIAPVASGTDVISDCNAISWIDGNTYSSSNTTATHTLVGAAADGCDSVVTLNYTHLPSASSTDTRSECAPFVWIDGNTYTSSNNSATHTLVGGAADGCDSVVTLDLTILAPATGTDVISDCNAITWIDGNVYNISNNSATHTLVGAAANGCDSVVTLNYTHLPSASFTDVRNECAPFTWIDGNTYSSDTTGATHTLVAGAADGCDSVVTLDLTILAPAMGTDIISNCNAITWIDGNVYNTSNNSATHTLVGAAANGCDSIVTLNFTHLPTAFGTDTRTECAPFTWIDGNTYTGSNNTATHTFIAAAADGCDSVVTLNLSVLPNAMGTDVISDCNAITWIDGNTYTSSNNTATHTLSGAAANGCDSIVTLNFTHLPTAFGTDTRSECAPFTWIDGNTYTSNTTGVTYAIAGGADDGCDSIVTLNLSILPKAHGTDIISDCNAITWIDGNTYTSSNTTATHTIPGGAANGCDSIVTLHFTHLPTAFGTDTRSECAPFTWIDGNTYTSNTTGVTHTLVGAAFDGCDSIVTLDLTILPKAYGTDIISDCNAITWIDGNTYSSSNTTATHTLVGAAANGCDSIVTLHYTHLPTASGTDVRNECAPFTWIDGNTYTSNTTGVTHTLAGAAADGCDSIVTLNLTILPKGYSTDVIASCDPITWIDGNTYTTSNNSATYTIPAGAASGCDSVITLNYTKKELQIGVDSRTECAPFVWIDGNTYTNDNNSASLTFTGGAADGCDSTVILDLTIIPQIFGYDNHVQCTALTWIDGNTYYESTYGVQHVIQNGAASGCDSTVILSLTIQPSVTTTDTRVECAPYTWIDGLTYWNDNNTATYLYSGGAADGCDSLVVLDLSIYPINTAVVVQGATLLSAANNGETYQWIDCDNGNQPIAGETNQTFTPSVSGNYAVIIDDGICSDTSVCYNVDFTGLDPINGFAQLIKIYPNPTNGIVNIDMGQIFEKVTIKVKNQLGQVLQSIDSKTTNKIQLEMPDVKGVYFLDILVPTKGRTVQRVVVN